MIINDDQVQYESQEPDSEEDDALPEPSRKAGGGRVRARMAAVQAIYQWRMSGTEIAELILQFAQARRLRELDREYFETLLRGVVYDAVKQIPAFIRLVASARHEAVVCQLRGTDLAGVAGGGFGIRIDNPGEEKFRAGWHQDYPSQIRSLDGLVFWSSLVPMTLELGPVEFCVGSHKDGLAPVRESDADNPDKTGAYGLTLADEGERVAKYEKAAPLTQAGDLVLVDFLTLHRSGENRANRSRWSMQMRWFNFAEPTGKRLGWPGSFAAGNDLRAVHPDLVVE